MAKGKHEGAQLNATDLQPSPDLAARFRRLTPSQVSGVIRIAQAELAGISIEALLQGPGKICSRSTYYHKARGGWKYKPEFQDALELARAEMRTHRLTSVVSEAIEELKLATPLAARDLRRQITGDVDAIDALAGVLFDKNRKSDERQAAAVALGQIGSSVAVTVLISALDESPTTDLRKAIIDALGAAGVAANSRRRLADNSVLDRADRMTADKGGGSRTSEMSDEDLERIAAGEYED
ncbi:MAG TPA: HEAT repeat domain-containing protein [Anaerolineae bacterium]|nr:HEAT repeat domain-containing protein [Anaerolineae bacterium]